MEIKNSADLKAAIVELEAKKTRQKQELTDNFHGVVESLKPINLIKTTFNKVKESPGLTGNVLKATLGLGVGLLSKKLLIGKSPGIFKKIIGSAVEMGVAGLVAKNSDSLRSRGIRLLKTVFRPKNKVTIL